MRQAEIDAELATALDDLLLVERQERGVDPEPAVLFDSGARGQIGELLERAKKLGPAVGIARVIDAIDADENVKRPEGLGPCEGEAEEDGVPRRDVGDRNPVRHHVFGPVLGNFRVRSERTAAEAAEVDVELDVAADAQRPRDPAGGLDLDGMPLAIANGQCVELEAGLASLGQRRWPSRGRRSKG